MAYSRQGGETGFSLLEKLREQGYRCDGYLFKKYRREGLIPFDRAEDIISRCFQEGSGIIFVCAMGIAVRQISGFIQSKQTDCAVLVMDEMGRFVIPVLSGHMGGANELARMCAELTGAVPVITTATDLHGKFAVDVFAVKNHLTVDNMKLAKEISADILESRTIRVYLEECYAQEEPHATELELVPGGIRRKEREDCGEGESLDDTKGEEEDKRKRGIIISPYYQQADGALLHLIPRQIILGIGCRKGITAEAVEKAVLGVTEEFRIDWRAVCRICTIDLKREEAGLLEFCGQQKIPLRFFSCEELALQEGEFTGSSFVHDITGVDNVCERSAMAGGGERLIVRKQKQEGVTVAAAVCRVGLDFNWDCLRGKGLYGNIMSE